MHKTILNNCIKFQKGQVVRIQWKGLGWQMKGRAWWEGAGKSQGEN